MTNTKTDPLRIAIVGTHGSRKTTAAHALTSALQAAGFNTALLAEVARTSPLPTNEGTTPLGQLWIATTQLARESELLASGDLDVLLTDAAILVDYAYYSRSTGRVDLFGLAPMARAWSRMTDLFVHLLPDVEVVEDGVCSTDEGFRLDIADIIDGLLQVWVPGHARFDVSASDIPRDVNWLDILERAQHSRAQRLGAELGPRQT